ncbi:multidrug DMT transporter [Deinococcus aestuarii]|uniref:multidrug DMT transporter n=1 Tax=Deinococcus aestuarii TaxID=2774531 RepID=UPI001C0C92C9|nr:multidrug DMT transporter [Deinococcus aestuarii]
MENLLKKAGAMLAHLELFNHMLHLRGLLQLAAHMEERGDRVTLISPGAITLVGGDMTTDPSVTTSKGATVEAGTAYSVLRTLKGHDAPEYAVTREELKALNARAVADLEAGDAMRAFGETLARIGVPGGAGADTAPERPTRGRRAAEGETAPEQPAA